MHVRVAMEKPYMCTDVVENPRNVTSLYWLQFQVKNIKAHFQWLKLFNLAAQQRLH